MARLSSQHWSLEFPEPYTWEMFPTHFELSDRLGKVAMLNISQARGTIGWYFANRLELLVAPLLGYKLRRLRTRNRSGVLIIKQERDISFYDAVLSDHQTTWHIDLVDWENRLPLNDIQTMLASFEILADR